MKKITTLIYSLFLTGFFLFNPKIVLSSFTSIQQNSAEGCVIIGDVPSLGCIAQIVSRVIGVAFTFLGLTTLVFLAWGAIKFIISAGDPKAIQSARNIMTYAIIGAVIVIGSFILVNVVTTALNLPNVAVNFKIFQP